MEKNKNIKKRKNTLLPSILLAVVLGFFAGITGEILVSTYFLKDLASPYLSSEYNLADLNYKNSNLIIRDAKKVVVSQDVKVEETINSIKPSLLRVFKKAPSLTTDDAYYKLNDPDFIALTITSDAWAIASLSKELISDFLISDYVALDYNREIYELEELRRFPDLPGEIIFFQLKGANNLPIKSLAARSNLSLGQALITISDYNQAELNFLSAIDMPSGVISSDQVNTRLFLANDLSTNFDHSFVFNLSGDLVALVIDDNNLVPIFAYTNYWQSFFSNEIFKPPFLGVNYLDLSRTKVVNLDKKKGAFLYSSSSTQAVLPNSPADKADLRAGDIITWVNNKELDYNNDLASVISAYYPEEEISLIYIRDDKEQTIKVKLEERNK